MGKFHDFIYQGFKYKLYVPKGYTPKKETPLVVMLHGCAQDPDDFAAGTEMNSLAERENFLVLYPNMNHILNPSNPAGYNPFGCWNWFLDKNQHRGQGHPKLIYEILEEVKRGYNIDANKVFAAGLSAGGSLACILGVTYPDVFNAIGICSGLAYDAANVFFLTDPMAEDAKKSMEKGVPDPFACGNSAFAEMGDFKKKKRVIVFHGICDTTVHPINGQQVVTQWAQTNFLVGGGKGNTDVTPSLVNAGIMNKKSYTQHIYHDENGEPLMEFWMIDQLGHAWPGGSPNGSYTDSLGPNATEIIWNFFTNKQAQIEVINTTEDTLNNLLLHPIDTSDQSPVTQSVLLSNHSLVEPIQISAQGQVQSLNHSNTAIVDSVPELLPAETLVPTPETSSSVTEDPQTDYSASNTLSLSLEQLPAEVPDPVSDHSAASKLQNLPTEKQNGEPAVKSPADRETESILQTKSGEKIQNRAPKKKILSNLLAKFSKKKR